MSSAVAGYKQTLGADAPPACYEDIDHADCIFIAGSNTAFAHPILFRRIEAAKAARPELNIIVVDPRRTDTAALADLHLPILPGTDIALLNAMLHLLIQEDMLDRAFIHAHTEGFDALHEAVREYTPSAAAKICGISEADIVTAARWFGKSKAALSLYCQGLNQSSSGTHKNAALINLHLATGHIGKPGAGPLSLTGQPNAMGGREVGGMANLLSAHRDMANPAHRAEVAKLWGIPEVPGIPGKTAVEMFDAIEHGDIKAIWIACTNPAQSMPDLDRVHAALKKAEIVVVQDAFANTDTTMLADVLLPASTWGEKYGTVTNSERRITHVKSAVTPPGEARHDWDICIDFARRLGRKLEHPYTDKLFPYVDTEEIFNEHRESTRGRDLDITGLSYSLLKERGPQQWPFPAGAASGKHRLYEDGIFCTPSGRARFVVAPYVPVAESTSVSFPLALTTGRLRDQWHGMSRTGTVARLFNHAAEPLLSMNPQDLAQRGLQSGDVARLQTKRGTLMVRVEASDSIRSSQAFMPMHWGSQFMRGAGVNVLMLSTFDPYSKQPELKHAAAEVSKIDLPYQLVAMRRFPAAKETEAHDLLAGFRSLMSCFDYATVGLAGHDDVIAVLRGYAEKPINEAVLDRFDALLQLDETEKIMRYVDARKRVEKVARIVDDLVESVCLSGETAAQDWLRDMMLQGASAEAVRPWILAPIASPPRGTFNRGRMVCTCNDVSESEIQAALRQGADLPRLQTTLKCGTSCGSCVPELKRIIKATNEPANQ